MTDAPHLAGGRAPPPPGVPAVRGDPRAARTPGGYPLVPVLRRIVTWEGGSPSIKGVPMLSREQVTDIAMAAASMPYVDPDDELAVFLGLQPSKFYGMTNLEVMLIRRQEAAARPDADDSVREAILDRLVGKPKTTAEVNKTVTTYDERIREIARKHTVTIDVEDGAGVGAEIDGL